MASSVTKLFRKYNKHLLVFFAVALMVAFLLPGTLRRMFAPQPYKRVIAQAYGEDIRLYDRRETEMETQILNALNSASRQRNNQNGRPFNWIAFVQLSSSPILDYRLLILEARHKGIKVLPQQVDREFANRNIPPELINHVLDSFNVPLRTVRGAVANYLSVEKLLGLVSSAVKVSEPELKHLFIQTHQRIKSYIIPLSADDFTDEVSNPTEKDLTGYFAKNQERFRYPDRIAIEYIEADLQQIQKGIKISKVRARQYWKDHRNEFTKQVKVKTKAKSQPATTQSTKPKLVTVQLTFEEAFPQVVKKLKYIKARENAINALATIKRLSQSYWRGAPVTKTGVRQKPGEVSDYRKMSEEIAKKHGIKFHYKKTKLLSPEGISKLKGIGSSFILENGRPLFIGQYAFRVLPLIAPPSPEDTHQRLYLVQWQDSTGLMRSMGPNRRENGFYLFRVIKVDKTHLPGSLDEVREKVVRDYRENRGYELAKKYAEKLKQSFRKKRLSEVIKSERKIAKKLKIEKLEPQTFPMRTWSWTGQLTPPRVKGIKGNPAIFVDECFRKLWNQPTTQPDGTFTSAIISDDTNRMCYLVQFIAKEQAKEEDYKRVKGFLARIMISQKQKSFFRTWLNPISIHQRTQFQKMSVR